MFFFNAGFSEICCKRVLYMTQTYRFLHLLFPLYNPALMFYSFGQLDFEITRDNKIQDSVLTLTIKG